MKVFCGSVNLFFHLLIPSTFVPSDSAQNEEAKARVPKNPNEFIYQTPHNRTIVVYKKDFVPYTTRIYNFVQSFTGGPGTADK